MDISDYINNKKLLCRVLLYYIKNDDNTESNFRALTNMITSHKIQESREEVKEFLHLLTLVSCNYHRCLNFYKKIESIILFFVNDIKKYFSNNEIYEIFFINKRVLLFLIQQKILLIDDFVLRQIIDRNYYTYFYPEIKQHFDETNRQIIEDELYRYDSHVFDNFDEKRYDGENEHYICRIIRQDLIHEFSIYFNLNQITNPYIPKSIFETNNFLIENSPTMIDYALFFGSYKIVNFLIHKNHKIFYSSLKYCVFSNDQRLIHLCEENIKDDTSRHFINQIIVNSIRCYNNNVAYYFMNKSAENLEPSNFYEVGIACHNYSFSPTILDDNNIKQLLQYNYLTVLMHYLNDKVDDGEANIRESFFLSIQIFIFNIFLYSFNFKLYFNSSFFYLARGADNADIVNLFISKFGFYYGTLYGCNITHITLPNTIKIIPMEAFKESALFSIVIPSSVVEIENSAFMGCRSLNNISMSYPLAKIGHFAFNECESLTKIILPMSVTEIGRKAFSGCEKLSFVLIPPGVTKIPFGVFENCKSLKNFNIPKNVTEIEPFAFKDCASLEQIVIPQQVKVISNNVFQDCSNLTQVVLSPLTEKISEFAFEKCFKLEQISIPSTVTEIGMKAFHFCSNLNELKLPEKLKIISSYLCCCCTSLKEVFIPPNVLQIAEGSFLRCTLLESVKIPPSVKLIDEEAFASTGLKEIILPPHLTVVSKRLFNNCVSLKSVVFPPSLIDIRRFAFNGCESLEDIKFPDSLLAIRKGAFCGCNKIKHLSVPPSVIEIEENAFKNMEGLKSAKIPDSFDLVDIGIFIELDKKT
ncbi:hypothetical protein M9Y10_038684 [Tritrichomonas musculus]|uniref:Uncharacterized protein n=1 Tax=Tritrichomonas musculus TaxID=1915356 RepID=A0ABR2KA32_9EUKA